MVYGWCPADHVPEVGARRVVALTEVAVTAPVVAGRTVVPAVTPRGAPADRGQGRVRQTVGHIHQNGQSRSMMKTTTAGMQARSAILKLLTDELLIQGKVQ